MRAIRPMGQGILSLSRPSASTFAGVPLDCFEPRSGPEEVPSRLGEAIEAAGKPYYDEQKDQQDIANYYQGLDPSLPAVELYRELSTLVCRTHRNEFGFDPEKRLFPWVDLRPSLRLQSIYAAEHRSTDDRVLTKSRKDYVLKIRVPARPRVRKNGTVGPPRKVNKKVDFREQAQQWTQVLLEGPTDAVQIAQRLAAIEGHRYFNAEHAVPQVFFGHRGKPKGDLHNLFTCERDANSLRGCRPYGEAEEVPENRSKEGWAPRDVNVFEPDRGKGAVARATLYFLLRYPGEIGDQPGEYSEKDLATLLRWHREDPVGLYEKHRNQAIRETQGNRNPFIDFPELAERVDFRPGFATLATTE